MNRFLNNLTLWSLVAGTATGLAAGQWPHWRGPAFNGSAPDEKPPLSFSTTNNVLWTVPVPGRAASTPVVWDKHVFVSSADETAGTVVALCLDANSGQTRWQHTVSQGTHRDERSNYASASPVTDGKHVWFYNSLGDLVAFDVEGRETWRRNLQKDYGEFAFLWTFASSPLLYEGRLYLQVLQRDVPVGGRGRKDGPIESFVLALDSVTGRELWRQVRPSEARQESREAFSSPVPLLGTARPEILVVGGDCLTGHDPATGRELWRWGTWNPTRITHWRLVPSPVSGAGYVLACTPKGGPVYGIRTGAEGTLAETGYSWKTEDRDVSADVPTPLFYEGRFYVLNGNRHTLSAIDPASGKTLWTGALDSSAVFEASPTAADGRIFAINHRGELFVVAAGDTFKLLDKIQFGTDQDRRVRASVALAGNRAFVRTDARLFCFGDSR